jgi:hypothetical protein
MSGIIGKNMGFGGIQIEGTWAPPARRCRCCRIWDSGTASCLLGTPSLGTPTCRIFFGSFDCCKGGASDFSEMAESLAQLCGGLVHDFERGISVHA